MSKKKRNKYTKWLGDNDYNANLVAYTSTLSAPPTPSVTQDASSVPDPIRLSKNDTGVRFGQIPMSGTSQFIGMRQEAEGNIMVVGGNGSGKSSGIAKPTLYSWKGAMCVTDIKGELSSYYEDLYRMDHGLRPYLIFTP